MYKLFLAMNSLLGKVLGLLIVGLLGAAGWFGYHAYWGDKLALEDAQQEIQRQQQQIESLGKDLEAKQREIERLNTALKLLKVDRRVARVDVVRQEGSDKKGDLSTTFSFVEVDEKGEPLDDPRTFTIKGDVAYFDTWVVKFLDEYVEQNDPLRSASLYLFKRIFGEAQQPKEGFALDQEGGRPAAYRNGRQMSDFERKLWDKFWQYANDPDMASKEGVRAIHGEAPSMKLVPGMRYRLETRASGGLSIVPVGKIPEAAGKAYH